MDSLGTGTGIGFQDWTVSEPESESKKLEPGTSVIQHLYGDRGNVILVFNN